MNVTIKDRIKAHRSAPDVYDPPTFEQMADHIEEIESTLSLRTSLHVEAAYFIEELEAKLAQAMGALEEIRDIAALSEGVEFYEMFASKRLNELKGEK